MKILIISDVHGRNFWKKPTEDMSQWDKVVFLGDYVDPYDGEASKEDVIPNLLEIVALKEVYKDKVILLWGNHDCFYWCDPYRRQFDYWSRHDNKRHDDIEKIFLQHNELFQWAWQYEDFLFTHAGVTNIMARFFNEELGGVHAIAINKFFNDPKNQILLAMVSQYRGGGDNSGSILWADIYEHFGKTPNKFIENLYQIFGHTYSKIPLITKHFAMLDTGGGLNYLEDGVLKDVNGNKMKITEL